MPATVPGGGPEFNPPYVAGMERIRFVFWRGRSVAEDDDDDDDDDDGLFASSVVFV